MTARRARVAPTLRAVIGGAHLDEDGRGGPANTPEVVAQARRELRALLAVERASLPVLLALDRVMKVVWPGRANAVAESASLRRALVRLRRASGGEGR